MISLRKAGLLAREAHHDGRFEAAMADPRASQARVLMGLVRRNAATAFGREHGFASIRGPAELAACVPVRDYEGFRPYVDRIVRGEDGVLTADPVTMFTTTSGTTAEPKLIPVTDRWRRQMEALMRLWMYRTLRDHPRYLDHKVLLIPSPAVEAMSSRGIPIGSLSGVTYQRIPRLVRRSYAVPYAVTLIDDPEARHFITMRLALARRVSALGTPNPTSLLRLAETAVARGEDIVRAIADGTLGIDDRALTGGRFGLAAGLRAYVRPDAVRARFLEGVMAEHGALLPGPCWPDLQVIGCWLGGTAGLHAERLAGCFGAAALRDLGLMASEGRMTVPVEDGIAAGPLAVHDTFYEFIPEPEVDSASPSVLGAHELELGRRYSILLTGGNGLYRYDINDIVEVRGFKGATPEVAFVRKGRDMVSITGEKLHLNHLQAAMQRASRETGIGVRQFRLIADGAACRHDLLVEFQGHQPGPAGLQSFLGCVDRGLQAENPEYRSKRVSGRLGSPQLSAMRTGWSERACLVDFRKGRREAQHKWKAVGVPWDADSRDAVSTCVGLAAGPAGSTGWRLKAGALPP